MFSLIILSFLYIIYNDYKKNYELEIFNYLNKEISFYQRSLLMNLWQLQSTYNTNKPYIKEVHEKILHLTKEKPNLSLLEIKNLINIDKYNIELKLVNIDLFIVDSSLKNDVGVNVSIFPSIKDHIIYKLNNNIISQSANITYDLLSGNIVHRSYSKINDKFLVIDFINKNTFFEQFNRNIKLYKIIYLENFNILYYLEMKNSTIENKLDFINKLEYITAKKDINDLIANSFLNEKKVLTK